MANPTKGEALVIGGAGFLGRHLVRILREHGHPVRVLSRNAAKAISTDPGVRYISGSISDEQAIAKAVEGCTAVFDLAAHPVGTWEEIRAAYVDGARRVAEACQRHGVRRLVYTSTTAVLDWSLTSTIDESAGVDRKASQRPGFYHLSKIAAEQVLMEMHAKSGLPVVILRPAIIVGGDGVLCHSGIGAWRDDTRCLVVGRGRHPLPFVLVQDVAAAFFAAMDAPEAVGKTFNLAGDVRPSALEMVEHIRRRSRRDFRAYPQSLAKLFAVDLVKYAMKVAVGKEGSRPRWHTYKCEQVRTQLDCSAAKKYLGWRPVAELESFLREAVDPHLRPLHPGDLRLTG